MSSGDQYAFEPKKIQVETNVFHILCHLELLNGEPRRADLQWRRRPVLARVCELGTGAASLGLAWLRALLVWARRHKEAVALCVG